MRDKMLLMPRFEWMLNEDEVSISVVLELKTVLPGYDVE